MNESLMSVGVFVWSGLLLRWIWSTKLVSVLSNGSKMEQKIVFFFFLSIKELNAYYIYYQLAVRLSIAEFAPNLHSKSTTS